MKAKGRNDVETNETPMRNERRMAKEEEGESVSEQRKQ